MRATLNLGHTFGHAIETATGYGTLLHGEAVSIGMCMAADMSVRLVSGVNTVGPFECTQPIGARLHCGAVTSSGLSRLLLPRLRFWHAAHRLYPPLPHCLLSCPKRSPLPPHPAMSPQGWIEPELLQRTRALLQAANLPVTVPAGMTRAQFRELMAVDKKVLAGKLRLVLLRGPLGGCVVTGDFDAAKLEETLAEFCPE